MNIDLQNMSMAELEKLQRQIESIRSTKTRTYRVSFDIIFRADRTDDIADPDSFADHVIDAFRYFGLNLPEHVTNVVVTEV